MSNYLDNLAPYWDKRFEDENKIWGDSPSQTVYCALDFFQKHKAKKIFVPGAGYGRHTKFFSSHGYDVCGVEISKKACAIAKENDPKTKIIHGSVLDVAFESESFDAIYAFNILHIFRETERSFFINKCYREVKNGGVCFFVVFSDKEESYGKGAEVEKNTFESKPGRPVHYFSSEDIKKHFYNFDIIEEGLINDKENHGDIGEHTHCLRYIVCKKIA
jgi:SAM-dependent methyltransferase